MANLDLRSVRLELVTRTDKAADRSDILLFVVATDSNRNGTFVRVNKNKNVWTIQVNFVIHAERANDVPDCGVDLRAMDLIVETAVKDNAVSANTKW